MFILVLRISDRLSLFFNASINFSLMLFNFLYLFCYLLLYWKEVYWISDSSKINIFYQNYICFAIYYAQFHHLNSLLFCYFSIVQFIKFFFLFRKKSLSLSWTSKNFFSSILISSSCFLCCVISFVWSSVWSWNVFDCLCLVVQKLFLKENM